MQYVRAVVVATALLAARVASAQPLTNAAPPAPEGEHLDLSYLWDGGAVPFIWAPMLGRVAIDRYWKPDDEPLLFSATEGGAAKSSWEVPGAAVTGLGIGVGFAMIATGDESRFYHAKGMAETLMTGALLTGVLKLSFSRHRPDWTPETDKGGELMSFPSGHSTQGFAIATYAGLFLHDHVFAKYRGDRVLPWYEGLSYVGLAAGASAIGAERILHNRHHLSDVAAGAALGTTTSLLFYWYQERRFQDHHRSSERIKDLAITPSVTNESTTVGLSFRF
ncbi:MAG TPA: phosphatase PAP2 family protein [Kofleriaceae bacterium]|jgi:membrane-associated phospholipid phosphatase